MGARLLGGFQIEELSEEELDRIKARFEQLARKARAASNAEPTEASPRESPQDAKVLRA